jgi:uracil-DNA glycosylase
MMAPQQLPDLQKLRPTRYFVTPELEHCQLCPLSKTRQKVVPLELATGQINDELPNLLLVGRNPGEVEDTYGRPFIGPAGQVLRKIVEPDLLKVANVFYVNVVKCFTPKNREPNELEKDTCRVYFDKELKAFDFDGVMLFGLMVQSYMFKKEERHYFRRVGTGAIWSSTYHPSYVARGNKEAGERISKDLWHMVRMAVRLKRMKGSGGDEHR